MAEEGEEGFGPEAAGEVGPAPEDASGQAPAEEGVTLPPQRAWALIAVFGAMLAFGLLYGLLGYIGPVSATLFTIGGLGLAGTLVAAATLSREMSDEARLGMGIAAGLVFVFWSSLLYLGWATAVTANAWTCGTAIAVPSIGGFWGLFGFKGFLLEQWGIGQPVR